jgi:sialic acid synthase SpsE
MISFRLEPGDLACMTKTISYSAINLGSHLSSIDQTEQFTKDQEKISLFGTDKIKKSTLNLEIITSNSEVCGD